MKTTSDIAPPANQLRWNRTEPAPKEEMESFWKKLRQFYRTGKNQEKTEKITTSALSGLLDDGEVEYPFTPDDSEMSIDLDEFTVLHMLDHLLPVHQYKNRQAFKDQLAQLIEAMGELLPNQDKAFKTAEMSKTYDFADALIAFDKMANVIPKKPTEAFSEKRLSQLRDVIQDLQKGLGQYREREAIIVADKALYDSMKQTGGFDQAQVLTTDDNIFEYTRALFSKEMRSYTRLIKAIRVAQLETEGKYKEEIHGPYFEDFTWYRFTNDEMHLFQPIVVIVQHKYLMDHLTSYSQLVASNQPVN
ncbi:MAG: hypothetical protein R3345_12245, partial [Fulvivirga sp.]|nr:hypothetical protein [Fulvivirga sp.]